MGKRILLSLGGNALGTGSAELVKSVDAVAKPIASLVEQGYEIVLCHGNGPQVGMLKTSIDYGSEEAKSDAMPLCDCVAMSQSYIGHRLQNAIENELKRKGIIRSVSTVITRVLVDREDPHFSHPTKPVGAFLTREEALAREGDGKVFIEDSGRGYREIVPSPRPVKILEKQDIVDLLTGEAIVIAGGGGGIPVYEQDGEIHPIDAVIDKDWTSVLLAADTLCDSLVILTAVEKVAVHFNKFDQRWLDEMTVAEALRYMEEGEFPEGSMLPKVEAAIEFVRSGEERRALITSLDKLEEGLAGKTGTWIVEG